MSISVPNHLPEKQSINLLARCVVDNISRLVTVFEGVGVGVIKTLEYPEINKKYFKRGEIMTLKNSKGIH